MSLSLVPHQLKTFATANAVSPSFNYYIDPKDIVERLAEALLERRFCLLFGHRQSGKTTAAISTLAYLRSYTYQLDGYDKPGIETYYMTLQNGIDFTSRSSFWWSFCRTLRANYPQRFQYDNSEPPSSATFTSFFRKACTILQNPVVLIIDEASILYEINHNDEGIVADFIGTLRGCKDNFLDCTLHAVVLVGTESVREVLASHSVKGRSIFSPFTEEATYESTRFTPSQVQHLLRQFSDARDVDLDVDEISNDIYELTQGHKGLVGVCGTFIQERLFDRNRKVTLGDWKANSYNLQCFVESKQTYSSILRCLPTLGEKHREILGNVLRNTFDTVSVS